MSKNNIVIIGDSIGLPFGYAPSTRITNLAFALESNNASVEVILVKPSEPIHEVKNENAYGTIRNIKFQYSGGNTTHSSSWLGRRWQAFVGFFNAFLYLFNQRKAIKTVVIYSRNIEVIAPICVLCKLLKIKTVLELCEWPVTQFTSGWFSSLKKKLFCKYALAMCDGVIYISTYINNCIVNYEHQAVKEIAKFHLPILCDATEFEFTNTCFDEKSPQPYFLYCGNLSYKELIQKTMECMKLVFDKYPQYRLIIAGSSDDPTCRKDILTLVEKLNLSDKVKLTGFVSRKDLIELYKSAFCLILPLENDDLSNARFPTKLSEYLLSGRPVVVNGVGEIPKHLKDAISAYIPKDDSAADLANSAIDVINSPQKAQRVGLKGRQVALHDFNYKTYQLKLSKWICKL